MPHVVIAPDSFKGSATAADAAAAIAAGWREVRPDDAITLLPQADGGEGTLDAMAAALPGATVRTGDATGPDGRTVTARRLLLADGTGVIELAESSGLPMMRRLDPLGSTTRGVGDVIRQSLDDGATALVLGLGGSASTDGGAGALQALGVRLLDAAGRELPPGGGALARLAEVDTSRLVPAPAGGMRILSDVVNPLLGPTGAAAVFAPQKGAGPAEIAELERGLSRLADLLGADPHAPGMGAAGGTAYGFAALWGATVVPGSAAIAEITGLPDAASAADVLIVGEGRFDATSLGGKVVGHALGLAGPTTRVVVIAGRVDAAPVLPDGRPAASVALVDLAGDDRAARGDALRWLRAAGRRAAEAAEAAEAAG